MRNEQKNTFTNVLTSNPYTNQYMSDVSNFLISKPKAEFSKEQFVSSYINTKDYINNKIEINKNIPNEDIEDAINIKVYDELGLDQAIEYKIQFIETYENIDGDNRHFQVFIVDPLTLEEIYSNVIDKIKYIDTITPAPLLLKSLYAKEIIEDQGIHCFIYFEENDAFLTIYNEAEFIYTKSLKYSLYEMHERFCELYGEQIEYSYFIGFLESENLKHTQSDYKEYILKLYKEIFSNINDILTYTKKAFQIEKVEHIYIGSQIDMASRLYEMSEVELSITSSDFNFDYSIDYTETHIDQMHALMYITSTLDENSKYNCNFSIFDRPPKFIHRQSGKLSILLALSLFVAFSYPITYWTLMYTQDLQYELLQQEYKKVNGIQAVRFNNLKSLNEDKEKALQNLEKEKANYTSKRNTLVKIHDIKVNYPMKAKLISELSRNLNKFKVQTEAIRYKQDMNNKQLYFDLVSTNPKRITTMIKKLTQDYENRFEFTLEKISFNVETNRYISTLEVKVL